MTGARIVPRSNNRELVYDLLTRAKRYHCAVNGTFEFDVTDLLSAISRERAAGRQATLVAALVRATSLLLERFPRLNHHLFHGLFRKKEVAFEGIDCNLVLLRKGEGRERILLPLVLRRSNEMSVAEIAAQIRHHRHAPLESLPQIAAIRRLERVPRLALRWFSYKARSDWRFYIRHFGTYGLSSLIARGAGGTGGAALSNTATAFLPGTLALRPAVHEGKVVPRQLLPIVTVADHYIIDGHEIIAAMKLLRTLLERPAALGLTAAPDWTAAPADGGGDVAAEDLG